MIGKLMYTWANDLFPINRSLTGEGVRQTLNYINKLIPNLSIYEVPTGSNAFDWVVPNEWTVRDAYIADEFGNRIVDFKTHNLHVIGYSEPIDIWLNRQELDSYLYSLPEQPNAIPYVTSYYERRWGFCLSHNQRLAMPSGLYHVLIDSDLKPGVLNYAELIIPGEINEEIFISTYICHPSMANNELSGPVVTTALAQWLNSLKNRRYTYRIVFIPETIGSIIYLSKNIDQLKKRVIGGFNITCVGDERCYSFLPSRAGNSLSDDVAQHVLKYTDKNYKRYTWLDRGSDERQYCSPGIDLPIATIMRSKYGEYPEYHTSLDDLSFITPSGLEGSLMALQRAINIIEKNIYPKVTRLCEPHLSKYGLYSTLSSKNLDHQIQTMMNLITYCDGSYSLLEIANLINEPFWELIPIVNKLKANGLLS